MKYLKVLGFNLFALIALWVFVFSDGGTMTNLRLIHREYELRYQKYLKEIELEQDYARLKYLKGMNVPDANLLAQNGRKMENTVIFKFTGQTEEGVSIVEPAKYRLILERSYQRSVARVLVFIVLTVFMMLTGNLIILVKLENAK